MVRAVSSKAVAGDGNQKLLVEIRMTKSVLNQLVSNAGLVLITSSLCCIYRMFKLFLILLIKSCEHMSQ